MKIRDFLLKLLIFFIPLQSWEPFGSPYFNVTFLCFFIYFLSSLGNPRNFSLKNISIPVLLLFLWWSLFTWISMENNFKGSMLAYSTVRQIFMQLFFFILISNHLKQSPHLESPLLKTFIFNLFFLSLSFLVGFETTYVAGRLKLFGMNANALGFWYLLGIFISLRFIIESEQSDKKLLYLISTPFFIFIMILTGSRSAFILFFIGSASYLMFTKRSFKQKVLLIFGGLVILLIVGLIAYQVPILRERFLEETDSEFTLGGRLYIWEATIGLIEQKPILGAGASGYEYYMGDFMTRVHAPHNIYLLLLAYTGFVGLAIFLMLMFFIWKKALVIKKFTESPFYLAILTTIFSFFFVAGGLLSTFTLWFYFGMINGLGILASKPREETYDKPRIKNYI